MRIKPFLYGLLAATSMAAMAATFSTFTPATGILKGSASSSTTTAAVWSDVAVLLSGTCNSSVFVRGDGSCMAVNLTSNVTGLLPAANGGLGFSTVTDDTVAVANGSAWQSKALTDCDSASSAVTYDVTTNAWGCNSITTSVTGANPSASVGLTAVNGAATTYLRSDGAPALSQSIAPTWTGLHTFTLTTTFGNDLVPNAVGVDIGSTSQGFRRVLGQDGSTSLVTYAFAAEANSGLYRLGTGSIGLATVGTNRVTVGPGILVGTATGGDQGAGTLNATAVYDDGVLLANAAGANPSASVGLSAVNGAASTFMRSDGAPALSQSISPTWSGSHTFSNSITATGGVVSTSDITRGGCTGCDIGASASPFRSVYAEQVLAPLSDTAASPGFAINGDANTGMYSISGDRLGWATAGTLRMDLSTVLEMSVPVVVGSPTGGSQGAGTINATGMFINGVPVTGGQTVTATFSSTLTGYSSGPSCSMKYRLTGSRVDLYLDSGSACQATSNAATLTLPSLPSAIQPSRSVYASIMCNDNGALSQCAGFIDVGSPSVVTFRKAIANTGTGVITFGDNFTASGNKGLPLGWIMTYDLGN